MEFTDLIQEHYGVISEDLCNQIIDRFQVDDDAGTGMCGIGTHDSYKISTDLLISQHQRWRDIDTLVYDAISPYLGAYMAMLRDTFGIHADDCHDTGYQVQWTTPGGHFLKHSDYDLNILPLTEVHEGNTRYVQVRERVATYILYLNDRKGVENGRTIFTLGDTVKPVEAETGKLLLFPAYPFYQHEGEELETGEKYIMTGWITVDTYTDILDLNEEEKKIASAAIEDLNLRRVY